MKNFIKHIANFLMFITSALVVALIYTAAFEFLYINKELLTDEGKGWIEWGEWLTSRGETVLFFFVILAIYRILKKVEFKID